MKCLIVNVGEIRGISYGNWPATGIVLHLL